MDPFPDECPTLETLTAFFEDDLPEELREAIEIHFDYCDNCTEVFSKIGTGDPSPPALIYAKEILGSLTSGDELARSEGFRAAVTKVQGDNDTDKETEKLDKTEDFRAWFLPRLSYILGPLFVVAALFFVYQARQDFPKSLAVNPTLIAARDPHKVIAEVDGSQLYVKVPDFALIDIAELPVFPCRIAFDLSMSECDLCGLVWAFSEESGTTSCLYAGLRKTHSNNSREVEATLGQCDLVREKNHAGSHRLRPTAAKSCGFAAPNEVIRVEMELRKESVVIFVDGTKKIEHRFSEIDLNRYSLVDDDRLGIVVETGSAELNNFEITSIH